MLKDVRINCDVRHAQAPISIASITSAPKNSIGRPFSNDPSASNVKVFHCNHAACCSLVHDEIGNRYFVWLYHFFFHQTAKPKKDVGAVRFDEGGDFSFAPERRKRSQAPAAPWDAIAPRAARRAVVGEGRA